MEIYSYTISKILPLLPYLNTYSRTALPFIFIPNPIKISMSTFVLASGKKNLKMPAERKNLFLT